MKARWTSRSALVAGVAVALVASATPAATAGTHRLEAETGTIVDTGCGDDGPMAVQSGGTGQVVFFPGNGCALSFGTADGRRVDAVNFLITGVADAMCGWFEATGSLTGVSDTHCVDGTSSTTTYATVPFATTGTGTGSWTITWHTGTGTPTYVNAFVDYLTYGGVEAESGTLNNPTFCGDDGPMRVENAGSRVVVFYPGSSCSQTFARPASVTASLTGITFSVTGTTTACGRFDVTGAYVGSSSMVCAGTGYQTATVSVVPGLGSTFTITWSGSPVWANAYVDYLTFSA